MESTFGAEYLQHVESPVCYGGRIISDRRGCISHDGGRTWDCSNAII